MVRFSFSDIEDAFMFVSSDSPGMASAVLRKDTGKILYRSEIAGIDEMEEEEKLAWDVWIPIPHKNDLNLGRHLVFDFVAARLPDDCASVEVMFRSHGAYYRYKNLLERRGLLQEWYDFENSQEEHALRQWCENNGIELDG